MGCHFDNDSNYQDDSYLKCLYCGEKFRQRYGGQEFCSSEHELLYRKALNETKKCSYCGKDFIPTHSRQKYCCPEHRIQDSNDRAKSKRAASIIGKTMKCVVCGKEFVASTVQSKYCSKECSNKVFYQKARAKRLARKSKATCEVCGKPLTEFRSYLYCSKECSQKAKRQMLKENSEINRQMAKPKRSAKSKKPVLSISEICKLAMAEHLTYGQYVEKYGV